MVSDIEGAKPALCCLSNHGRARGISRRHGMFVLQYAGNVLVYGPASPCDGDWYGGVTADGAEAFLDALMAADVGGHGGVGSAPLRPLWRGRMGLSKAEQLQVRCADSALSAACRAQPPWRSGSLRLPVSCSLTAGAAQTPA